MTTQTIYPGFNQITAIEKAIREMEEDGMLFDYIEVINNGPKQGSQMKIDVDTNPAVMLQLGLKAGKHLFDVEEIKTALNHVNKYFQDWPCRDQLVLDRVANALSILK